MNTGEATRLGGMMVDWTIRQAIDQVLKGQVRIPAFQRGFVWDADRVAFFMDSLYKEFPFGSLLIWRTREALKTERRLGPFELPNRDPDYPVEYVLDGQQRLTSVFGVFQRELQPLEGVEWSNIYFDYRSERTAQENQFLPLTEGEADPDRYFPLNCLFDTVEYRKGTRDLTDEVATRIDALQARFKEVRLPLQLLVTENRGTVAVVFERVNRSGIPLDTLQLLTAWTWSEEFDLQVRFRELADELQPFGFNEVGADSNLLLRCCAAVVIGSASPESLVNINGGVLRERFQEVTNGIKGAVDFLRENLNVHALNILPFPTVLVPLCVYFAVPANQHVQLDNAARTRIIQWFWRTCFSRRYSSGVLRNLENDIAEMRKLKNGQADSLGNFSVSLMLPFFVSNSFRLDSVNTKSFLLLLAQENPLSFVSGQPIRLGEVLRDYNRNEFHHLFPRAFLRQNAVTSPDPNCLANFTFLSRADNNTLGGESPGSYRRKMPADVRDILRRALCPEALFLDDFDTFVSARSFVLTLTAYTRMGIEIPPDARRGPVELEDYLLELFYDEN